MLTSLYFWLFRFDCKPEQNRRYIMHLMGAVAFMLSAKKHWGRGNRKAAALQIPQVFKQLRYALKVFLMSHDFNSIRKKLC